VDALNPELMGWLGCALVVWLLVFAGSVLFRWRGDPEPVSYVQPWPETLTFWEGHCQECNEEFGYWPMRRFEVELRVHTLETGHEKYVVAARVHVER
jgi:hypothetical protein